MKRETIVAGHGGQGVLELANWLAYSQLVRGRHVAYTPSYGPETRGGKVRCYVVASDDPIASPIVETPDLLIVMNTPSMDFVPSLRPGGTLLVNRSLVGDVPAHPELHVVEVPATQLAADLGPSFPEAGPDTSIAANAVMLGAVLALEGGRWPDEAPIVDRVLRHYLTDRKAALLPLDAAAAETGFRSIRDPSSERAPPARTVAA